ncbi:MAG: tRNA pseudouridine13 synthase [Gammaproteobacteria bacterium]|nr:tRNA pseudouridine13 synthase [Gammaproteobacteria bacterium]
MSVHGRHPEVWSRAALSPPRAHGVPLPLAQFKAQPEDFRVEEQLSFMPSGSGPHWLLRVEKRAANTRWVAAEIARLAGVPANDVGYAGLKDRQAVTVQWFSVPVVASTEHYWSGVRTAEFKVLDVQGNSRKLRRGALTGNRFRIRLRETAWSREQLELKLAAVRAHGVPNYFGPQRFGRDGYNLDRVAAWVQTGAAPPGRTERSFALSAARALLFNAVLARRVEAGDWSQLAPGDLASLDGSGSHFRVTAMDEELQRRLTAFDVHPSGPLWGRGEPQTGGRSLGYEMAVAQEFAQIAGLLATEGLTQERRSLRCPVRELAVEADAGTLTLSFMLGRGQFATSALREICELGSTPELESDEE